MKTAIRSALPLLAVLGSALAPCPVLAADTAISAAKGGAIAPEDIMRLDDMRDIAMSPDGTRILYTVTRQMATFNAPLQTIWQVPADGSAPPRRLATSAGINNTPRFAPDGAHVAFLSDRANPLTGTADLRFAFTTDVPGTRAEVGAGKATLQIWMMPSDGGEAVPLTAFAGSVSDFAFSPDGKTIAFLATDPPSAAEKADKEAGRDEQVMDATGHFTRLWLLDLATGRARRVSPEGVTISQLAWSPDGTRIAVRTTDKTDINTYFYFGNVALLDPATGALGKTLIAHSEGEIHFSPDGTKILSGILRTPGFIGLGVRVHDLASGETHALADDYAGLFTHMTWTRDGKAILATTFEKTRSHIVRLALDGTVTTLADLDGEASDLEVGPRDQLMAVSLSSPDRPADVWTVRKGTSRPITQINPEVARWSLGKVEEISWKSSVDARTIYGVLVTPPGYDKSRRLPTIVQIHGGPEWAWWSGWLGSWHEWAQMLATHGYAVLLPNIRGSDGQGTDFARAVGKDWGGGDYQDMLDGLDSLEAQGIADPKRLGIGGWSYGGFMTAWSVTHTKRFKAGVMGAAPVDMAVMARATDTPDFTTGYFGEPQAHLADLDATSSVRLLDKVETPVLILSGAEDTRVPPTMALQFYRGLRLLDKPAQMVRYPREPHWFHEPAHQEDVQRRVLGFFDAHLRQ
ncbi:S9 family peptidase [Novosphingobium profundi]|uniref:S9 family peptidase n=1 Tax=Novosphingobium profundi TaxID=1774954 RepID=UPI001BDA7401|nr:S9 family peptidase [Novosphingobium profundi]MBT0669322.1 S9 family peptidase [Novosphingobium profundi]